MKVLLLISFLIYNANGASISDIEGNEQNQEQQLQEDPAQKIEKIKNFFSGNERVKWHLNKTMEVPRYHESAQMKYGDVDIRLILSNKVNFLGDKIDADFKHKVESDGKFFVKVHTYFYNRKENYDLTIDGTVKGKSVNETGKLILNWDKVGFILEANANEISTDFNDVSLFFDCTNPSVKTEGLEILDQIEKDRLYSEIYNILLNSWTKGLMKGKVSTERKNMQSCISK